MKCPHCQKEFHSQSQWTRILQSEGRPVRNWYALRTICPACSGDVISFGRAQPPGADDNPPPWTEWWTAYPKAGARPVPPDVPQAFASDFEEAAIVLGDSAKASAALSRRCLQNLLHNHVGIKKRNLDDEIQALLDTKTLPSQIADAVDAVRSVGNFAAHAIKSQQTGVVTDVEPGEAEWTLEVLESLFDFYFVAPAKLAERRAAVNKKLKEAGKPLLKESPPRDSEAIEPPDRS